MSAADSRIPPVRSNVRPLSAPASANVAEAVLSPSAQALARAALAPATVRAYRAALAALDRWLADQGRPADDAALADYLAARHDAGAAPASIAMTVSAVKAAARLSGQPSPAGEKTGRVLAGIRREGRGRGRGQAKGLHWSAADTVAAVAANGGRGSVAGLRDAAGLDDGPLFRRIRRGDRVEASAITDRAARSIIQARAADAWIEGRVSGHSLRIGAAQSLAAAGAGLVELQQAGRWDIPSMPAHYARGKLAARGAIARLRHGKGTG